jgi:hypothetical protein
MSLWLWLLLAIWVSPAIAVLLALGGRLRAVRTRAVESQIPLRTPPAASAARGQ